MKILVGIVLLSVGLIGCIKVAPETFLKGCTLFDQEGKQSIFSHFHTSTLRNNHALKQEWIRMKAFYIGSPYGPQIGISDRSHLYSKSIIYNAFHFRKNMSEIYTSLEDYISTTKSCDSRSAIGVFGPEFYRELDIIFKKNGEFIVRIPTVAEGIFLSCKTTYTNYDDMFLHLYVGCCGSTGQLYYDCPQIHTVGPTD